MKDQIAADLQKAKAVGGAKVEKIRQIFREAFSQSVAELKEGGSEIGSIAKTSTSTLIETLQSQPKTTAQEAPIPVEVIIESDEETADPTDASASEVSVSEAISPETIAAETIAAETIESDSATALASDQIVQITPQIISQSEAEPEAEAQIPASEAAAQPIFKTLLNRAVDLMKEKGVYTKAEQQWVEFKQQLDQLDGKLDERFGERYTVIKQDFHKDMQTAKGWYDKTRANAAQNGTFWVDQKQSELEVKAGEAGATMAQKEEKIKHLLKELWKTVTR